jgi:hypothetical protein
MFAKRHAAAGKVSAAGIYRLMLEQFVVLKNIVRQRHNAGDY